MSDSREDITPNPPRWKPNPDPSSIHVSGLDISAPLHDQIEQIEQLITFKLQVSPESSSYSINLNAFSFQNIDETFSKIHNVLATKILPAVKRYGVGTEPVREAARVCNYFLNTLDFTYYLVLDFILRTSCPDSDTDIR